MIPLISENLAEIRRLCGEHHVARLWLFGSAATGEFDPARSDVDFVVEFKPSWLDDATGNFFGLEFGLEEVLGRQVDLVELTSVRDRSFRESFLRSRLLLFGEASVQMKHAVGASP